ncbi:hypothetical protein JTB14_029308 [Gonioctena quinquepunctata]|nr:hypothetical protein JTB14_029308 [Gonioctena quinquepunctata]
MGMSLISTKLIRLAIENRVILKLPPHTTELLQPLDVAVFRGIKSSWDKELCKWKRQNLKKKNPKAEFARILSLVLKGMPTANIVSGFRATGIYDEEKRGPNKDRISLSVFKPDDLRR